MRRPECVFADPSAAVAWALEVATSEPRALPACDRSSVLRDIEPLLRGELPVMAEIEVQTPPGGQVMVRARKSDVARLILNLATNACAAMAGKGRVELALESVGKTRLTVALPRPVAPGAYARLTLRDTGPGLPETVLARAHESRTFEGEAARGGLGLGVVIDLIGRREGG